MTVLIASLFSVNSSHTFQWYPVLQGIEIFKDFGETSNFFIEEDVLVPPESKEMNTRKYEQQLI